MPRRGKGAHLNVSTGRVVSTGWASSRWIRGGDSSGWITSTCCEKSTTTSLSRYPACAPPRCGASAPRGRHGSPHGRPRGNPATSSSLGASTQCSARLRRRQLQKHSIGFADQKRYLSAGVCVWTVYTANPKANRRFLRTVPNALRNPAMRGRAVQTCGDVAHHKRVLGALRPHVELRQAHVKRHLRGREGHTRRGRQA